MDSIDSAQESVFHMTIRFRGFLTVLLAFLPSACFAGPYLAPHGPWELTLFFLFFWPLILMELLGKAFGTVLASVFLIGGAGGFAFWLYSKPGRFSFWLKVGIALVLGILAVAWLSQVVIDRAELSELVANAEKGDAKAQFKLGQHYSFAGSDRKGEAEKWFEKAAAQENAEALCELGLLNRYKRGEKKAEYQRASVGYFRRAAERGHTWAQNWGAEMIATGEGVPPDLVEGYAWFLIYQASGNSVGSIGFKEKDFWREIRNRMATAQIDLATVQAKRWVESASHSFDPDLYPNVRWHLDASRRTDLFKPELEYVR